MKPTQLHTRPIASYQLHLYPRPQTSALDLRPLACASASASPLPLLLPLLQILRSLSLWLCHRCRTVVLSSLSLPLRCTHTASLSATVLLLFTLPSPRLSTQHRTINITAHTLVLPMASKEALDADERAEREAVWRQTGMSTTNHAEKRIIALIGGKNEDEKQDVHQNEKKIRKESLKLCLIHRVKAGGVSILILVHPPRNILDDSLSSSKGLHISCIPGKKHFNRLIYLIARLVGYAHQPEEKDAKFDDVQVKAQSAIWVAFFILSIRPDGGYPT